MFGLENENIEITLTVTVYTELSTELGKPYVLPPPSCLWVSVYRNRTGYFLCLASLNSVDPKDATGCRTVLPVNKYCTPPTFLTSRCPEVVKREKAGEKDDVLAVGCILYQMATLNPTFYSTNMLSLATKKQVNREYSFCSCLTPDPEAHPDIVEVSSLLSDVMMKYLDVLPTSHLMLEKKLDRERRRTQRYFMEADRNAVTYHHQLSILSQIKFPVMQSNGKLRCLGNGKNMFSELDDELDILNNSSSSSSSNLKGSAIGMVGTSDMAEGMAYGQLQTLIEEVLEKSDYYSFSSNRLLIKLEFQLASVLQLPAQSIEKS
ncbi:hypothetical protein BTVI_44878 [Pitangus sulphuratus]|nr:hypothetical protein BTVI_44878 [Pitangus sulphuratus]